MYLIRGIFTLVGAAIVGFAIPAGWMRVGAEIQLLKESGTISMAGVAVVFVGIIASYYLIIWLAGMAAAHRLNGGSSPHRFNWNRSMRDERHQAPTLNRLETLFVTTAILVGGAYMVWFFFFAEATFPGP